jgi:hypothetical protein
MDWMQALLYNVKTFDLIARQLPIHSETSVLVEHREQSCYLTRKLIDDTVTICALGSIAIF